MQSRAQTVEDYLAELPEERREQLEKVRETILKSLPKGYEETILYGMICYVVPFSLFPQGYHCDPSKPLMYASLASQKNYMAVYLMGIYFEKSIEEWFVAAYKSTGKKLDMGKSCVRFKKIDDLPLEVVGEAIAKVPVEAYLKKYLSILDEQEAKRKASRSQRQNKPK